MITKDGNRMLWTDDCKSYGINRTGINSVDKSISTSNSLPTFDVVSGSYKDMNNKLLFTDYDSLVLHKEVLSGNLTLSSTVFVNSISPAGIVFDYKDGNYFYFAIDNTTHETVLYKVTNGEYIEIERNYISASYRNDLSFDMIVEIADGKYYCKFFNTMYFTGDLVNNSNVIG